MTSGWAGRTATAMIAFVAFFVFTPVKALGWGAELHFPWTYMYALQIGYPHQDAYLMGIMNYNIDFGDTSSFPIFGNPDYHNNTNKGKGLPDSRDLKACEHLLESWRCAFTGNDEGFLFNTAAALHAIQDKDAHLDYGPLYHGYHFVMGTIFYGNGKYYSWLDDPYSEDVFTIKSNPTAFSSRGINSLRNTEYVLKIQKPFYDILMAEDRAQKTRGHFVTLVGEKLASMGLTAEERWAFEHMAVCALDGILKVPGSLYQSCCDMAALLGMHGRENNKAAEAVMDNYLEQGGGEALPAGEAGNSLPDGTYGGLKKGFDPFSGLFDMSEEWFEALGVLDYSRPVDAFELVGEMLAKRVARCSTNLMREEELLQLRLEKLPGR